MNQVPSEVLSPAKPALRSVCSDEFPKRSRVYLAFLRRTQDGEKGWGPELPPAFFRKSFTCLAQAFRLLSRPIPLFISILRGDGLVGKEMLVARQVKHSFDAGGNGL